MIYIYPDAWESIAKFLESDDLFAMSATCKSAYRAFKRISIQEKISFPLISPKRLTYDQRDVIRKMEQNPIGVKLISSPVGSGKTIVSLAYTLRNPFDRIFIVVPPALIKMWWQTCKNFFGIDPLVLHTCNSKYCYKTDTSATIIPDQKIILTSYKIFDRTNFEWLAFTDSVLIVDEAHHHVSIYGKKFKEIVALSATVFRKNMLAYGINNLLGDHDIEEVTFQLEQKVIASKLDLVIHLPPHKWKISKEMISHIMQRKYPGNDENENNLRDVTWISQILTHPFIMDLDSIYLGETILIGKKRIRIPKGNPTLFFEIESKIWAENIGVPARTVRKLIQQTQDDLAKPYIKTAMRKCIKYYQCLSILEYLKERKEKAIILDTSVTYLPFLHKFLIEHGIDSYLFSTHYDVTSRQTQLEKFKKNPDADVLISSICMLGEGHNVTEANHVIFLSALTDPGKYYQAIGRCHRYPQSKTVYVHHMFNSEFEQRMYEHSNQDCNLSNINWENALNN